ncbi:MAG: hypothetical protein AAF889_08460 [Cyanobacteria bacterium P01_D01_bin.73]
MSPLPGPSDPFSNDRSPLNPPGNDLKSEFLQRYAPPVEPPESVSPAAKKLLNKVFVWVLLIGIAVGGLVSVGVAIALQRAGLLGVPDPIETPAQVAPSPQEAQPPTAP